MPGRQIPDPKLCVGVPASVGRSIECVTCERRISVYQTSKPDDHFRCGYCSRRPHAARVTEFVLDMPGTIQVQMQGPQHCGPNCNQCRPPIIVPPPGAHN